MVGMLIAYDAMVGTKMDTKILIFIQLESLAVLGGDYDALKRLLPRQCAWVEWSVVPLC